MEGCRSLPWRRWPGVRRITVVSLKPPMVRISSIGLCNLVCAVSGERMPWAEGQVVEAPPDAPVPLDTRVQPVGEVWRVVDAEEVESVDEVQIPVASGLARHDGYLQQLSDTARRKRIECEGRGSVDGMPYP